ncbi:hypothetical protein OROGR_007558 [Orobanche gracilis]
MELRAQELSKRLNAIESNQIVLAPCNVGFHWILTVIDPHKEEIAILDPLYNGNHDENWKMIVELALKLFNVKMGKKGRKNPTWTIIKFLDSRI